MGVTIKDVARRANVGVSTVSRAMNNKGYVSAEAMERIKQAVEELGYRPDPTARALIRRKVDMVALIVDCALNETWVRVITSLENELFAQKLISCVFILSETGEEGHERYRAVLETVQEQRMSGIIFLGGDVHARDEALYTGLLEADYPMVGIECYMPDSIVVASDQEGAGRIAARHLLRLGHQRIGFLREQDEGAALGMQTGWRKAMHQASLPVEPWWEVQADLPTLPSAKEAMLPVLSRPDRPTAFLCYNDDMAMGLLSAAWQLGLRVPEDLSVVGHDNMPSAANLSPGLTTTNQPAEQMAHLAVQELLARMDGRECIAGKRLLGTELIVRGTTAPPPGVAVEPDEGQNSCCTMHGQA